MPEINKPSFEQEVRPEVVEASAVGMSILESNVREAFDAGYNKGDLEFIKKQVEARR
jgi:hypothetical protein